MATAEKLHSEAATETDPTQAWTDSIIASLHPVKQPKGWRLDIAGFSDEGIVLPDKWEQKFARLLAAENKLFQAIADFEDQHIDIPTEVTNEHKTTLEKTKILLGRQKQLLRPFDQQGGSYSPSHAVQVRNHFARALFDIDLRKQMRIRRNLLTNEQSEYTGNRKTGLKYVDFMERLLYLELKARYIQSLLAQESARELSVEKRQSVASWNERIHSLVWAIGQYQVIPFQSNLDTYQQLSQELERIRQLESIFNDEHMRKFISLGSRVYLRPQHRDMYPDFKLRVTALKDAENALQQALWTIGSNEFSNVNTSVFERLFDFHNQPDGERRVITYTLSGYRTGVFESVDIEVVVINSKEHVPIRVLNTPRYRVTKGDTRLIYDDSGNLQIDTDGLPTILSDRAIERDNGNGTYTVMQAFVTGLDASRITSSSVLHNHRE